MANNGEKWRGIKWFQAMNLINIRIEFDKNDFQIIKKSWFTMQLSSPSYSPGTLALSCPTGIGGQDRLEDSYWKSSTNRSRRITLSLSVVCSSLAIFRRCLFTISFRGTLSERNLFLQHHRRWFTGASHPRPPQGSASFDLLTLFHADLDTIDLANSLSNQKSCRRNGRHLIALQKTNSQLCTSKHP